MNSIKDKMICFWWKNKLHGRNTLYRVLGLSRRIQCKTKHGIILKLDPTEYIDKKILQDGYYEPEVLYAIMEGLREGLREGDTFWDVGSNLGLHALTVKKVMPSVQVVAFEPNSFMHSLIVDAASANHLDLEVREVALSSTEGKAEFFIHRGNCSASSLYTDWGGGYERQVQVNKSCGDRLVANNDCPYPHVLKMDVEGHELEVCRGCASYQLMGPRAG